MESKTMNGIEFLSEIIDNDIEKEIEEIKERKVEIPDAYNEQMEPFIQKLSKELNVKKKKRARQRWLRTAALFAVTFISLNAAALGTSEAYREKVFSLIYDDEQGSVNFYFDPTGDMVSDWEGYWIPTWLPEGFQLTTAEKDQFGYYMVFQSGDSKETIRLLEYTSDSGFSFDTETLKMEHVKIGFSDGYYFEDPEQNMCCLLFNQEGMYFLLEYMSEDYNRSETIKIAELLEYKK